MRKIGLAVLGIALTSGCVLGEQQLSMFEGESPDRVSLQGRFDELAESSNPGWGVVPDADSPTAWVGMGTVICAVVGSTGAITTDIFIDGEPIEGLILLDGTVDGFLAVQDGQVLVTDTWGTVEGQYPVNGDVLAGQLTDEGIVLLVSTDTGCVVILIHPDGTQESWEVDPETCDPNVDIEQTASGDIVFGGPVITQLTPDGLVVIAAGTDVAADSTTGAVFTGTRGENTLTATYADGTASSIPLHGALTDFAARDGRLVAMLDGDKLAEIDPVTGATTALESYTGRLGIERLQLNDRANGLFLTNPNVIQFYRLNARDSLAEMVGTHTGPTTTGQAQ